MIKLLQSHLLAAGITFGTALLLVTAAQAAGSSQARDRAGARPTVTLRKTALGTVLVDGRGRTLYLFEKDRKGVSLCNGACAKNWPPLTARAKPVAGKGLHTSLLRLGPARNGARQVTYAGHPLYAFVGDTRAGQTAGEEIDAFGGEWYAVGANGRKVEKDNSTAGGSTSAGGGYGGYGAS